MSSEAHHTGPGVGAEPTHDDVSFEARDVQASTIYKYLLALGLAVILSYFACIFVLRLTTRVAAESDTPPPPVRQEMGKNFEIKPPEPRLQGVPGHTSDPQADLREKIKQDTDANEKAGWIDQNAGIAQIPVRDAMKIIAERGLPGASASPAEKKQP
jgi:hypothetical protein